MGDQQGPPDAVPGCPRTPQPRWPCLPRREARGGFTRPFPPFRNYFRFCKSTTGFMPTSVHTLFPYYMGFKTFWAVPGTFPNTSGSRILLPVLHTKPEMVCQQVCFTSTSDHIPLVPFESIFTRFSQLSCPKWQLKLLPVPFLTANLDLSHPVSLHKMHF